MNNQKKKIDELLNRSQCQPLVLNKEKKEAILQRAMEKSEVMKDAKEYVKEEKSTGFWNMSIFSRLAFGVVSLSAVCLILFFLIGSLSRQDTGNLALVIKPSNSNINANDDFVILYPESIALANMILGMGGSPEGYSNLWKVNPPTLSSSNPGTAPVFSVDRLNKEDIERISGIFGINADIKENCLFDRYSDLHNPQKLTNGKCLSVSDFSGIVDKIDFEQESDVAGSDGISEALGYIKKLTGIVSDDEFLVQELNVSSVEDLALGNKEYLIYPKVNVSEETVPYYPPYWHVSLIDGKLSSLLGNIIDIPKNLEESNKPVELISEKEAYTRMLSGEAIIKKTLAYYDSNIPDNQLEINISDIKLEYIETYYDSVSPSARQLFLMPVYRIIGQEKNSQETFFESYVDASKEKELFSIDIKIGTW